MDFRTTFSIEPQEPKINYTSEVLSIGSCFVENIGKKLDFFQIPNFQNPFGILYHPAAIEKFISRAVGSVKYTEAEVFHHNERWHSFDAHSALSDKDRETLVNTLNKQLDITGSYLNKATHLILTLGTGRGYRLEDTGEYVANCHKLPQRRFVKELMPVEEIVQSLRNIINAVAAVNPVLTTILTVSPIRHIKDGFMENQQSKSHLIAAIHKLKENSNRVKYFPSYEIMMDDLRDYRFYAEDMVHPNSVAIDYIWKKFRDSWISGESLPVMEEVKAIRAGLAHRPFYPESRAHQSFLDNLHKRIENLKIQYPHIRF